MGYYKETLIKTDEKSNGKRIISSKFLPILTLGMLVFSSILFLIFAYALGSHWNSNAMNFPTNPINGQKYSYHIKAAGLWSMIFTYTFIESNNSWELKQSSCGLSTAGILCIVFLVVSLVLYFTTAIKLNCGIVMKSWFVCLSCIQAIILILVIWTMVHQYNFLIQSWISIMNSNYALS